MKTPAISASRRTDLARFYPDWLADRLRRLRRKSVVVVVTKYPAAIYEHRGLREALSRHHVAAMVSITGMGGLPIEPRVPPWQQAVAETRELIAFLGSPERVRLRFDPIVYSADGWSNVSLFPQIARSVAELGIKEAIFSFVHLYPQVKLGLRELGIELIDPPPQYKLEDLEWMMREARGAGVTLHGCCTLAIEGVKKSGCIDGEWLCRLFDVELDMAKDPKQRRDCRCIVSRDIGSYHQRCYAGCGYCYAQKGGTVGYLRGLGREK